MKFLKKILLVVVGCLLFACVEKETSLTTNDVKLNLIPQPNAVKTYAEKFVMDESTVIYYPESNEELKKQADVVNDVIFNQTGLKLPLESYDKIPKKGIVISPLEDNESLTTEESYKIEINTKKILLSATTVKGLFYAIQTFRQLLPLENEKDTIKITCLEIDDTPRLPYRGMMLDPARHFLPAQDVKKYIDAIAMYKFNTLHLHLSDDQGWRIEIKKYPKLMELATVRKETDGDGVPHGGYYTQDELKDIVAYAKERFIEVIPEIDVPGHSQAMLVAYPELTCFPDEFEVRTTPGVSKNLLCAGNDKVFEFYGNVYKELAPIFTAEKFHIGGDEAPLDHWKACSKCQKRIKDNNLESPQHLMSYFFERISDTLAKHGKTPQIWYELDVPFYPETSTMYTWRGGLTPKTIEKSREMGYKLICSPGEHAYFDYPQAKGEETCDWMAYLPLEQVYKLDPGYGLPQEKQAHIIGVEATIWGEYVKDIDRAFYMTFPRAMALSEAGWTQMDNRGWNDFKSRLKRNLQILERKDINYREPKELANDKFYLKNY
ncbi:beta-N-acetylhexosaminidase [Aestuariivivens marinum]|uniref:beta-N-acetylhexosaminidase n=1 Tax=Aestuariivivens marinum TaxID=2913555 RepID=UPI001F55DA7D|nr:beta-N-acetylhexosaminidase [Aestuariivivens marinum]